MKTLDDAVIELNGLLPSTVKIPMHDGTLFENDGKVYVCNFKSNKGWLVGTVEHFQQRAKELGFINGYRWGVEYKTDGRRPDLPDDVGVSAVGRTYYSFANNPAGGVIWGKADKFIISDPRYKPADTSYLDKTDSSLGNKRVEVDMVAMMEREFAHSSAAFKELIGDAFYVAIAKLQDEQSKAERKKVVEVAMPVFLDAYKSSSKEGIEALYDKGFLKLPD